jgi:Tol biopolymer transport system component
LSVLLLFSSAARAAEPDWPTQLIGCTEFRTNLTGGRHPNIATMRATVRSADGMNRNVLGDELIADEHSWTQFAGWSPDGKLAIIGSGWESPENAAWEEEHKTFRFMEGAWKLDSHLFDLATGTTENVTAVDRVSFYNSGLFFWWNEPTKLGFTALIDGNSHPFQMDRDGRNKVDLTKGSALFSYGFQASPPDGRRISYHQNYQIVLADADGSNAKKVETGHPFNFAPTWSPDGKHVLFVSGEHYDCHPTVVRADGTELRKIADRNGYRGVTEFLDVPDFHGGSSDTPIWTADGGGVIYTTQVGNNVELFLVRLNGLRQQITRSPEGTTHYHPQLSPDGKFLVYGSKRNGVRQIFVRRLSGGEERQITNLIEGHAAMWPHWQPR